MANRAAASELVDAEVYNASGAKVWQRWQSPVTFSAGAPQPFTFTWALPQTQAAGVYTLKLGVFTSAWRFQAWNNGALTVTVSATGATAARALSHTMAPRVQVTAYPESA